MKATISIDYSRVTIPSIFHCSSENYLQNRASILPILYWRVALLQKPFCSIWLCVDALSIVRVIVESKKRGTEIFDSIIDIANTEYKGVRLIEIQNDRRILNLDANKLWTFKLIANKRLIEVMSFEQCQNRKLVEIDVYSFNGYILVQT